MGGFWLSDRQSDQSNAAIGAVPKAIHELTGFLLPMKIKRNSITKKVAPEILERAEESNVDFNAHLQALRSRGYKTKALKGNRYDQEIVSVGVGADISLDTSVMMVETSSIVSEMQVLQELHDRGCAIPPHLIADLSRRIKIMENYIK